MPSCVIIIAINSVGAGAVDVRSTSMYRYHMHVYSVEAATALSRPAILFIIYFFSEL